MKRLLLALCCSIHLCSTNVHTMDLEATHSQDNQQCERKFAKYCGAVVGIGSCLSAGAYSGYTVLSHMIKHKYPMETLIIAGLGTIVFSSLAVGILGTGCGLVVGREIADCKRGCNRNSEYESIM